MLKIEEIVRVYQNYLCFVLTLNFDSGMVQP